MENTFIQNKYTQCYMRIVNRAKFRNLDPNEYYEKHHIIPGSFYKNNSNTGWIEGNSEAPENKVFLTGQEHFLCHFLLTKMIRGQGYYKAICAVNNMRRAKKGQPRYIASGRIYAIIRRKFAEEHSKNLLGKPTGRTSNGLLGHKQSEETIKKRAESLKGCKRTLEQKERMRQAQLNRKQKTEEEKLQYSINMSKAKKGILLGPKSKEHKKKLSEYFTGRSNGTRSEETKQKMRKPKSEEHKANMRKPKSPEHIQAIKEAKAKKKLLKDFS
jgi:hypothetical protein